MKFFIPALLALGLVSSFLTSCESTSAPATRGGAQASPSGGASPDGKRIYYGRCTSCHAPDPVRDYTRSEWHGIISEMAPKAKLNGAERSAVLAYVLAHAADS